MNPTPQLKYQIQEQLFDAKSCLDEDNFYAQRQGSPSELTKKMTYILGDYTKNYPISTMTLGAGQYSADPKGNKGAIELDDVQFTYPVMGRLQKASVVTKTVYSSGDKPGIGNSEFKLYFSDNWLKRFFIIQSGNGVQARIQKDLELVGGQWEATCVLAAGLPSDFVPLSEVTEGAAWIALFTAVPESYSRSTETAMAMPGQYKNQMGFMRAGMSWAGNSANKVMKIEVSKGGQKTNVWMDWFMWQFEQEWLSQCEHYYWYSRYNRAANGTIPLVDLVSNKVIPIGSGILEQIGNKSSYSSLSLNFLSSIISDATFGKQDNVVKSITLMTGTGGMREFDRAAKAAGLLTVNSFQGIADKFITGSGNDLALGGYFNQFTTIDGKIVKVKLNPVFDNGRVALAQAAQGIVHPETGWPLESYRMVFIDDNDYDGQPNIVHVAQKGRSFIHGVVKGLTPAPRSLDIIGGFNVGEGTAIALASDVDQSSYTRMKSAGIQILNATNCFDLICTAGQ